MTVSKASKRGKKEEDIVTIDRRREDRRDGDAEAIDGEEFKTPRRKKQRRRHIDPTTCERDYNGEEIEFMRAMDDYKRDSGRMFPTCSEVLEVVRALGYVKLDEDQAELLIAEGLGDGVAQNGDKEESAKEQFCPEVLSTGELSDES